MEASKAQGGSSALLKAFETQALGGQLVDKTLQYLERQSKDDKLKAAIDLQNTILNAATAEKGARALIDILA
jgi:hypothetical protein